MKRLFIFFLLTINCLTGNLTTTVQSWIRINQLGYTPGSLKVAVFVSKEKLEVRQFGLYNAITGKKVFTSTAVVPYGAYGAFASTFRLDFSAMQKEGAYYIEVAGIRSPVFRISGDVWDGTADFLLRYMRQQRCGYNPFLHDSCHMHDGYIIYHPTLDSVHIDVTGGWHDATDYLQYTATSANAVFQMLLAYRENPQAFSDAFRANGEPGSNGTPDILDEALWGLDWLLKMNPDSGQMYNQIADDRDHAGFRLPNADRVSYGKGLERPVYFCTGKPQGVFKYKSRATGIASTAGKYASAFALGAMMFEKSNPVLSSLLTKKAIDAYAFGEANPGACQTAPCTAPYFYEEDNWVDDMQLAAAMLFQLTGESRYRELAIQYGRQEPVTPWMGADTARHYQWYPFFNMGHYITAETLEQANRPEFLDYWKTGIDKVYQRGKNNPFLNGIPFIWCSNNLTTAMISQCHLYAKLSGDNSYSEMESALRDWLFGCNPWGTSMVIGLPGNGDTPSDPHSSLSVLKHYPLDGGLVDGPVYASIFNNLKGISLAGGDEYEAFQSKVAVYHDDYADYSTNEPTMDGTADLTYYLSAMQKEAMTVATGNMKRSYGGIIRGDQGKKQLCLVFTGHEFDDGYEAVKRALDKRRVKGGFFLTGDFYRNPKFTGMIKELKKGGHYLGAHSDKHLLYCDWNKRDSLLVTKEQFVNDIKANYAAMEKFGLDPGTSPWFLPPYEWYNDTIAGWCRELGLQLVNFSPGTSSNQDWTYPELGKQYISSDSIYGRILNYAVTQPAGLNGFILLTHFGTDPRRTDKLYNRLDALMNELENMGYRLVPLQEIVR